MLSHIYIPKITLHKKKHKNNFQKTVIASLISKKTQKDSQSISHKNKKKTVKNSSSKVDKVPLLELHQHGLYDGLQLLAQLLSGERPVEWRDVYEGVGERLVVLVVASHRGAVHVIAEVLSRVSRHHRLHGCQLWGFCYGFHVDR